MSVSVSMGAEPGSSSSRRVSLRPAYGSLRARSLTAIVRRKTPPPDTNDEEQAADVSLNQPDSPPNTAANSPALVSRVLRRAFTSRRRHDRLANVWLQAAATAAEKANEAAMQAEADDPTKKASYRVNYSTPLAPFLLGMSSLGGAMVRKGRRRMSDFTDIEHLAEGRAGMQLTDRHKTLLSMAWSDANRKGAPTAGEWIFGQVISECPEVRDMFNQASAEQLRQHAQNRDPDVPVDCLVPIPDPVKCHVKCQMSCKVSKVMTFYGVCECPLAMHGAVFTNALDMIIESLDCLDDSVGPLMCSYGAQHMNCGSRELPFRPEYWDVLCDAMIDYACAWRGRAGRADSLQAWRMLVLFVTKKLREGYAETGGGPAQHERGSDAAYANTAYCRHAYGSARERQLPQQLHRRGSEEYETRVEKSRKNFVAMRKSHHTVDYGGGEQL